MIFFFFYDDDEKSLAFYVYEFYATKAFDTFQSQGFICISHKL